MRCGHCGEPLPTGALFCGECGRAVQSAAPSTPRTARVSMVTPIPPPPPPPSAVPIAAPPPPPSGAPASLAPPPGVSPTAIIDPIDPIEPTETGDTGGTQDAAPVVPTPASTAAPRAAPSRPLVPGPALDVDDDDDGDIDDDPTTVSPRRVPPAVSATVVASTGQRFQIGGRVLLGRRPSPAPGEEYDAVLVLVDDGKTISKTHLELNASEERITVTDLGSGNGTVIETPGEPPVRCVTGVPHPVPRGSRLVLGRQYLVVA